MLNLIVNEQQTINCIVRILLSICCGGVIGIERGKCNQPAGMRTHILVCLGATIVMLTSDYIFSKWNSGDPARLGAQVISGIGFLGAGSIIVEGRTKIRGLTTAAGLWVAACIGLAIGIGFYAGGILSTIAVYFVISKSKSIAEHFTHNDFLVHIYVEFEHTELIKEIKDFAKKMQFEIIDIKVNDISETDIYNAIITLKSNNRNIDSILEYMKLISGVRKANYIY